MRSVMVVSLAFATMLGCGGAPASPAPPPTVSPTAAPSAEVLRAVCHAEHVDETSEVFVAIDGEHAPARIIVTPTRRIADMGNLIFDLAGTLLGEDTGGEVPWNDAAFMATEHARVAALMGGAAIPAGAAPVSCASLR